MLHAVACLGNRKNQIGIRYTKPHVDVPFLTLPIWAICSTACKIKVIDYGNAYLRLDQRCSYVQSRAYRAPEVVLGLPYSTKVDLWSLGCILMELFTGILSYFASAIRPLSFHMGTTAQIAGKLLVDNRSVQALLASHITLLGPLPPSLIRNGQLSNQCVYRIPD